MVPREEEPAVWSQIEGIVKSVVEEGGFERRERVFESEGIHVMVCEKVVIGC